MALKLFPNAILNFETVPKEHHRLFALINSQDTNQISVDLSLITHCNSAGLALLIELKRQSAHRNITCEFLHVPHFIKQMAIFGGVASLLLGNNNDQ